MSNYKVLVDSSVWIDYFRSEKKSALDELIDEDLVCINDVILSELLPFLSHRKQYEVIEGLEAIELIPLVIDWPIIRQYQLLNLKNGVNNIGIPDLLILQQVVDRRLILYSFDKHFQLMQNHLHFDVFEPNREL